MNSMAVDVLVLVVMVLMFIGVLLAIFVTVWAIIVWIFEGMNR